MRLTKQTSYAIRILIHCANAGERYVKANDIASFDGITEYNVAKIVPLLVRGGFLATSRGRCGGLKLAKPASEINLGDVIRVTETTHVEAECVGGTSLACSIKQVAPINLMLGEALEAFINVLEKHTLADLVHSRRPERSSRGKPTQKARTANAASANR
jgi:Rrf2 family protein